jgi:hypothetical protein
MEQKKLEYVKKLEKLEEAFDDGYDGIITAINEITNTKYYGTISNYGERNGISIEVKLESPDGEKFSQWMSIPENLRGTIKSNIYAFKRKYGKYPQKGMKVEAVLDEDGFFRIVI